MSPPPLRYVLQLMKIYGLKCPVPYIEVDTALKILKKLLNFDCILFLIQVTAVFMLKNILPYVIYIYNSVCLFVCLFVCSFRIQAKTTAQNATKLSGIIKWGSVSVLHGLKLPVFQFLKRYPSISVFCSWLTAILLIIAPLTFVCRMV